MWATRLLGWLAVAAVLTTAALTATPNTALACSCVSVELSDYADDISVAFAGHQLDRVVHDYVEDNGTALLFRVERVYKGEAGPLIEVRTHAQGPACGIDAGGEGTVGVVARHWRGDLSVNLCGSIVAIDELEEVFGGGYSPDESIRLPVSLDPEEDLFHTGLSPGEGGLAASQPGDSARDQRLLAVLIVAGAAAILVIGTVAWRRRR